LFSIIVVLPYYIHAITFVIVVPAVGTPYA